MIVTLISKGFKEISRNTHQWYEDNNINTSHMITVKRGIFYFENPNDPKGPYMAVSGERVYETPFYGLDDVKKYG